MHHEQHTPDLVALIVVTVLALASPARAQDCPELVGRWPYGGSLAVAASADFLYLGNGTTLTVADLSDPAAPHVLGHVELPSIPQSIAVSGGHAYVADGERGLRVVDVSRPSAPEEVGSLEFPPGHIAGSVVGSVAVAGRYACVTDRYEGLRVIDVSTPTAPVEVGFVPTSGAIDVAMDGDMAYLAAGSALRVIDLSTPSAPLIVGSLDLPLSVSVRAVTASGGFAYFMEHNGLRVVDVSVPSAPILVGALDLPDSAWVAVALSGGYAFVASGSDGFRVIDVGTPSAPVEVGFLDTPGTAKAVAVAAGHAYVEDGGSGLQVIDVSMPSRPVVVGVVDTAGRSNRLAVAGGHAYVAGGSGLRVFDVGTASEPVEVALADLGRTSGVALSDGYAWVATGDAGLRVLDISTPSAPVEVGFLDIPGGAGDVALSRGRAYVVGSDGLRVIDATTPTAPVEVGAFWFPYNPGPFAVSADHVYLTQWARFSYYGEARLLVVDVSEPSAPVELGHLNLPCCPQDVAVSGRFAYIADYHAGLRIIDVSEPSAPVAVGTFRTQAGYSDAFGVAVRGGYAYLSGAGPNDLSAANIFSLWVVDVTTPASPVEVGNFGTAGAADVAISNGKVYLTAGAAGLYVFDECAGTSFGPRESFIPAAAYAAGAQGSFFSTDLELVNRGAEFAQVVVQWLPRGEDNSDPLESEPIALGAGHSVRIENALAQLFPLGPNAYGALRLVSSREHVIGMSRTYTTASGTTGGTFGQELPAVRGTEMIVGTSSRRIIFLSENAEYRSNIGCVNGTGQPVRVFIGVSNNEGSPFDVETMDLGPYGNDQVNRVLADWAPVSGYVDVWADREDALYTCYGSVLDNLTSDPTTVLPR